jgi:hypothetical protein
MMAKDLGQSGVSIPKPKPKKIVKNEKAKEENPGTKNTKNTKNPESSAFADLNFKVSQEFKWEFKAWAANHQMSQKAALEVAFELIKEQYK